jgi:hypothetical protein
MDALLSSVTAILAEDTRALELQVGTNNRGVVRGAC